MDKLTVILADNQTLTRKGILSFLNDHYNSRITIEEAKNKNELDRMLTEIQPNALIIDFNLFDFKNHDEFAQLRITFPHLGILLITDNQTPEDIYKLLDSGFTNFILKTCEEQEFMDAFHATLQSRKYFCNEILELLLLRKSQSRQIQEPGKLTVAEVEIVRLISQGLTTKEIAQQKHLSFHTIITHRKNIFRKLAISNTSELLMYAMRTGIIDSTEYYI